MSARRSGAPNCRRWLLPGHCLDCLYRHNNCHRTFARFLPRQLKLVDQACATIGRPMARSAISNTDSPYMTVKEIHVPDRHARARSRELSSPEGQLFTVQCARSTVARRTVELQKMRVTKGLTGFVFYFAWHVDAFINLNYKPAHVRRPVGRPFIFALMPAWQGDQQERHPWPTPPRPRRQPARLPPAPK